MELNKESLGKMYDDATKQRDEDLKETRAFISARDELLYHSHIHQKGQDFWTELQDLEDNPGYNDPLRNAMRREALRRQADAKRYNEIIKTH